MDNLFYNVRILLLQESYCLIEDTDRWLPHAGQDPRCFNSSAFLELSSMSSKSALLDHSGSHDNPDDNQAVSSFPLTSSLMQILLQRQNINVTKISKNAKHSQTLSEGSVQSISNFNDSMPSSSEITGKIFKCAKCNEEFPCKIMIAMHSLNHIEEKPFICPYPGCQYNSLMRGNVKRHIRISHWNHDFPNIQ